MNTALIWDETKRQANREKHGLDFADAVLVLESQYRLDLPAERHDEQRLQCFAYVFELLMVLSVVVVPGQDVQRVVSFRPAKRSEREVYHEWLAQEFDEF